MVSLSPAISLILQKKQVILSKDKKQNKTLCVCEYIYIHICHYNVLSPLLQQEDYGKKSLCTILPKPPPPHVPHPTKTLTDI